LQVAQADAISCDALAIGVFGHIRLAAVTFSTFHHRLLKLHVFEGMQRVVMHKAGNRSLGGKKVGGVLDEMPELPAAPLVAAKRAA
jgi:hypothetical protein